MTEFRIAPLDRASRLITGPVLTLVIGIMGLTAIAGEDLVNRVVPAGLGALVLVLAWGFAPKAMVVDGHVLQVRRRLFGRAQFAVTGRVHRPTWQMGPGSVRKLGSGGLFGWYGSFWRSDIGTFHAYVTDRARSVLCETDDGPVVVSPADPDAFEAAFGEVGS